MHGVEWEDSQAHLRFLRELYNYQGSVGRYLIHEHSLGNMSWYDGVIPIIRNVTGVYTWEGQMDEDGFTPYQVGSPGVGWLSNSSSIIQQLGSWADSTDNGPHALAKSVLRGLRIQLISTGEMSLNTIGMEVAEEEHEFQEMLQEEWSTYIDDTTGMPLDSGLVEVARAEELTERCVIGAYIQQYL